MALHDESCCTIALQKLVVDCRIRLTRLFASKQIPSLLNMTRLMAWSPTMCQEIVLRLVVLRISNVVFSKLEFASSP